MDTNSQHSRIAERNARSLAMFGCTVHELQVDIDAALARMPRKLLAISILSDAQEEIARGNGERARQLINRAKYVVDAG